MMNINILQLLCKTIQKHRILNLNNQYDSMSIEIYIEKKKRCKYFEKKQTNTKFIQKEILRICIQMTT